MNRYVDISERYNLLHDPCDMLLSTTYIAFEIPYTQYIHS